MKNLLHKSCESLAPLGISPYVYACNNFAAPIDSNYDIITMLSKSAFAIQLNVLVVSAVFGTPLPSMLLILIGIWSRMEL
jgi:hypothetical protein